MTNLVAGMKIEISEPVFAGSFRNPKFLGNRQISGGNRQISVKFQRKISKILREIGKFPGNLQISGKCLKVPGNSFPGSNLPGYGK